MVLIVWWIAISHLLFPSLGDENLRIRRVPFTCALSSLHQQTVQRSFPVSADSQIQEACICLLSAQLTLPSLPRSQNAPIWTLTVFFFSPSQTHSFLTLPSRYQGWQKRQVVVKGCPACVQRHSTPSRWGRIWTVWLCPSFPLVHREIPYRSEVTAWRKTVSDGPDVPTDAFLLVICIC